MIDDDNTKETDPNNDYAANKPEDGIDGFANGEISEQDKQAKEDKRCKQLERFQIHMCLDELYIEYNPLLNFYKQFIPVTDKFEKASNRQNFIIQGISQ